MDTDTFKETYTTDALDDKKILLSKDAYSISEAVYELIKKLESLRYK